MAACATALLIAAAVPAQERAVAIVNARLLPIDGDVIEHGTLVLRDGKIQDLGADVSVPPGAEVVDAQGGTVMPGLVDAYSRAGLHEQQDGEPQRRQRFRGFPFRGGGRSSAPQAKNEASAKVASELYAQQDVYGEMLQAGVTTLAVAPDGSGFPGRAARLDPAGKTVQDLTADDTAYVVVQPAVGTQNKKLLKDAFDKAKQIVEERKKPPEKPAEAPKKDEGKEPAAGEENKEGEKKGEEQKEPPKPEPKPDEAKPKEGDEKAKEQVPQKKPESKDPNEEVLADLLEGKTRAFVLLPSAMQVAHFRDAVGDDFSIPHAVLIVKSHDNDEGRLDDAIDAVKSFQAPVLMPPSLTTPAYSTALIDPPATLAKAGIDVGFLLGDDAGSARHIWFDLMDLVRAGLPRDKALAGVTLVPARALGVDDRVGSLKKGKDADLLLLSGDPLDPSSKVLRIWHKGHAVDLEARGKIAPAAGGTR